MIYLLKKLNKYKNSLHTNKVNYLIIYIYIYLSIKYQYIIVLLNYQGKINQSC